MALSKHSFILEGIVTTISRSGELNIAPMGPELFEEARHPLKTFLLKPFRDSTTYRNLVAQGTGVFHVVDDVELIAYAAMGQELPGTHSIPCTSIAGSYLRDACSWYAFRVQSCEDHEPRAHFSCQVVESNEHRLFMGYNRAQNALLELTIVTTRLPFLPASDISSELERTIRIVGKTGGPREHRTLAFLKARIQQHQG